MKLKKEGEVTMDQWCTTRAQQSVQFNFWLKTLSFEIQILLLLYVRAIREGNFQLYLESMTTDGCPMDVCSRPHTL